MRVALLPLGAVEAHGPHLPLDTDTRIAGLLAARVAAALRAAGHDVEVAPPFVETACSFAADLPGTVHVDAEKEKALLRARVLALLAAGAERVALVNLHFDPEHVAAVRAVVAALAEERPGAVLFPDFTRRAHAAAVGGEFATGACHGGEFETSLMLVAAPHLVGPGHRALPAREVDLARAIRDGKRSFRELGLHEGYCGHPATATLEEGERVLGVLASIAVEAVAGPPS